MKADQKTAEQYATEQRMIVVLIPLFMAICGAISSTIFCLVGSGFMEQFLGFRIPAWAGFLVGGLVGGVLGLFVAMQIMKRSADYNREASAIGLQRLSDDDVNKMTRNVKKMFPGKDVRFWDCHFRSHDGMKIVMGDMGLDSMNHDADSNSQEKQQTTVYFEFDDFTFPRFHIKPEGLGAKLLGKVTGLNDINFEDSPEFSKRFLLSGNPQDAVRELFSKPIRDLMERNLGISISAQKSRLIIYRYNRTCKTHELEAFMMQCINIASELQGSGATMDVESMSQPKTKAAALAEASQHGGILGAMFKNQIQKKAIEVGEVTTFLDKPIPRPIPSALKNQMKSDPFLIIFGIVIFLGGSFAAAMMAFVDLDIDSVVLPIVVALMIATAGASLVYLLKMFENRKKRLLSHGQIRNVIIQEVTETAWVNGNQRVYNVKYRFQDQQSGRGGSMKVQGYPATVAQELAESGATTRALQDSSRPDKIMLVDCYAMQ